MILAQKALFYLGRFVQKLWEKMFILRETTSAVVSYDQPQTMCNVT